MCKNEKVELDWSSVEEKLKVAMGEEDQGNHRDVLFGLR